MHAYYYTYAPKHNYSSRLFLKAKVQEEQTEIVTGYYIMFIFYQIFVCICVCVFVCACVCVCERVRVLSGVGGSDNGLKGSSENIMVGLNVFLWF